MTAATSTIERTQTSTDRVRGLDSIRFLCALWVFFGHGAAPALANPFAEGSTAGAALRCLYANIWSGPAAVIVFFVISGFCIHFPFAGSEKRPRLAEFYSRRFLRLLLPVCIAIPLSGRVGVHLFVFHESILWSLLAEMIYYVCYPVLRAAQLRLGSWRGITVASFIAALAVSATDPAAGNYASYGPGLNWLLGLPCWLLGCILAESVRTVAPRNVFPISIWAWRAGILAAAWVCSFLRFHSPVGYPWTLNLFAVLVALWLYREIQFRQRVRPSRFFEWAGVWSYSLYLIHPAASALFAELFPSLPIGTIRWAAMVCFVLASAYLFYLCVEWPSHAIARRAAMKLWPRAHAQIPEPVEDARPLVDHKGVLQIAPQPISDFEEV